MSANSLARHCTVVLTACCGFATLPAHADRPAELVHLVRQDCGSCHGLTLQGGLGPALTASALRERPVESIAATILYGRPGTPMPPFRGILDAADVDWISHQLLTGFPVESAQPGKP